jgi:hypothetical protein
MAGGGGGATYRRPIYSTAEPQCEDVTVNEDDIGRDVSECWPVCSGGHHPVPDLRVQSCVLLDRGSLVARTTGTSYPWQCSSSHWRAT